MSMITRARSLGRHRGKTPLELRIALDSADDRATRLTAALDQLGAANTTLERQLDRAGIDYTGALEDVAARDKTIAQLEDVIRLRDQQIEDLKRKVDIGVKAEHVIAKTQEIDTGQVRRAFAQPIPLHSAAADGLLSPIVRISVKGASADPGHVPAA